jgi:hypothetical protein
MAGGARRIEKEIVNGFFYPTSWTVEYIQPKLHVFRRNREVLILPHQISSVALAITLDLNDYLTAPRLVFVTHGFRNTMDTPWMAQMKDALLNESDQTVILLGWGAGADLYPVRYLQAAANIQSVAEWLSGHLSAIGLLKPDLVMWGVGHSLGAHLIGIAGRKSGKLSRISALDPAGPGFEKHEFLEYRLQNTDAKDIVDVIHTDGYDSFFDPADWISPVNHYGTLIPLGTIDFYPNYGKSTFLF